jgi:BASS family bile acid:Na+ symporter
VLGLCFVVIIAVAWSQIDAVVRQGTLPALVVITLIWLAVGHLLGGPDEDDRTVLALRQHRAIPASPSRGSPVSP